MGKSWVNHRKKQKKWVSCCFAIPENAGISGISKNSNLANQSTKVAHLNVARSGASNWSKDVAPWRLCQIGPKLVQHVFFICSYG